jgi:hypothetical protein
MLQLVDDKEFRHNKVSETIPTNFQSRQFAIAHFTVHRHIAIGCALLATLSSSFSRVSEGLGGCFGIFRK